MDLQLGKALAGRDELAAVGIAPQELGELVLGLLDPVGLDQGQVTQCPRLAEEGRLLGIGSARGLGGRLLEQLGGLAQLAGRLAGLGQGKGRRLAVISDRGDLIDRHRHGIRADQDHHLVRRFGLDLAANHAADGLLDGRALDEPDLIAAKP